MYKLTLAIFFIVAVSYNSYGAQKMSGAAKSVASPRVNPEIGVEGIDNISLKLFLGSFDPKSNKGKLTGQSGGFSVGLGGSLYLERLRYLAIDLESFLFYRKYDTSIPPPLSSQLEDRMYLTTSSLTLGLRAYKPLSENYKTLRIYGSGGIGLFQNELDVQGTSFGVIGEIRDHDFTAGFYFGSGLEFNGELLSVSLDYRHFEHKGDFPNFDIKGVELGGDFFGLGIGVIF